MSFSYSRSEGFPTQYAENKTPVTVDVLEAGFLCAFVILIISFYITIIGYKSKNGIYVTIRVTVSLVIGLLIFLGNFGQEWEVGHIKTNTPYRAGTGHEINADIGLKIGLRSINVTLKGKSLSEDSPLATEKIDYNERFEWTWDQGRLGFGPQAGQLQREFREAQRKGLPLPILWIIDYLVVDGEGLRFGRFFRTAGWYAHIAMWTALPCWMLANIMFLGVVQHGATLTALTGAFQILACILWASIRNPNKLAIPFESGTVRLTFGLSYWLTLINGLFCLLIAAVLLLLDLRYPNKIAQFFGLDPLANYEEFILTGEELALLRDKKANLVDEMEMGSSPEPPVPSTSNNPEENEMMDAEESDEQVYRVRKRKSTFKRGQKGLYLVNPKMESPYSHKKPPPRPPPHRSRRPVVDEQEELIYDN